MVVCIKNRTGKILLHEEIPSKLDPLLKILKPYRPDITVACESTFNWYWLHTDINLIDHLDRNIMDIENQVRKQAIYHDRKVLRLL